jgi:hypothetical protein
MNKNRFKELLRSTIGNVKPLVSEQSEMPTMDTIPSNVSGMGSPTPPAPLKPRLPNCEFKMLTNSGPGTGSEMSGAYTKITTNGSVPPQYQGYTVHTADGPFCFIPRN